MNILRKMWSYVPEPVRLLRRRAIQQKQQLERRLLFRRIDAQERSLGTPTIAPARLRYRVSGSADRGLFIQDGKACAADIQTALSKVGRELGSFQRVLDFGCGCGRTLIHLVDHASSAQLYGTDIDADAIKWCSQNLKFASFKVSKETPPTDYQPETFDLIYAISVFTHLDEDYQSRWLAELRRIASAGATLLLTVDSSKAEEKGFVFENSYEKGLFPDWYQNAFHSREYVFDKFSPYFNVLSYLPRGMNNHQDVVIMQKPASSA
jgi:SAM-dependent methyltransferase